MTQMSLIRGRRDSCYSAPGGPSVYSVHGTDRHWAEQFFTLKLVSWPIPFVCFSEWYRHFFFKQIYDIFLLTANNPLWWVNEWTWMWCKQEEDEKKLFNLHRSVTYTNGDDLSPHLSLDSCSGSFQMHRNEQMFTRLVDTTYQEAPVASCPHWAPAEHSIKHLHFHRISLLKLIID